MQNRTAQNANRAIIEIISLPMHLTSWGHSIKYNVLPTYTTSSHWFEQALDLEPYLLYLIESSGPGSRTQYLSRYERGMIIRFTRPQIFLFKELSNGSGGVSRTHHSFRLRYERS